MAFVPQFYVASNQEIIDKTIFLNILKYPALCLVKDTKQLLWMYKDNTYDYILGDSQIVDIEYDELTGKMSFYNNLNQLVKTVDIILPNNQIKAIIDATMFLVEASYVNTDDFDTVVNEINLKLQENTDNINHNSIKIQDLTTALEKLIEDVKSLEENVYNKTEVNTFVSDINSNIDKLQEDINNVDSKVIEIEEDLDSVIDNKIADKLSQTFVVYGGSATEVL